MPDTKPSFVVLTGGIGGAKLVLGLQQAIAGDALDVIVNTGDDFEHLGLPICPDLDTLIYTLAGIVNPETGWGMADESWEFMAALEELNGDTWFRLGDRDLATHIKRGQLLASGNTLSAATRLLCEAAGLDINICPMSDDPVRTHINTGSEALEFQDYFVRKKAGPVARSISYAGSEEASASAGALAALNSEDLAAVFISPSNPWLSIDPILSLSDIESTIINNSAPVVAVSPIVGGNAIKGPTAKLMREFNLEVSALSIAEHYAGHCDAQGAGLVDGFIIDRQDGSEREAIESLGMKVAITNTIMNTLDDKKALAEFALDFAGQIRNTRNQNTKDCN